MGDGIYLIRDGKQLIEMSEQNYESEDLLQGLIAQYPNLLAGDQMNSIQPRRWLLISRERGLPSEEGGGYRWAVDHLFLDQDAIPTIVEVKRSSDTRIRREVVGQMLDYAANAVVYWPVEAIRAEFEARHNNPQRVIADFLGDSDLDELGFWQQTKTNLQAGKVRLVFVADEIPTELRRVVEFLNQQMDPTEVLAVEVKQYVGDGDVKALVPRVIGQTAEAERRKGGGALVRACSGIEQPFSRHSKLELPKRSDLLERSSTGPKTTCPELPGVRAKNTGPSTRPWTTAGYSTNPYRSGRTTPS